MYTRSFLLLLEHEHRNREGLDDQRRRYRSHDLYHGPVNVILVSYERRFVHSAYHLMKVLEVQRLELRDRMKVLDVEDLVATREMLDQGAHAAVESVLRDDEPLSIEVGSIRVQWMADVNGRLIDYLPRLAVAIHEEDVKLMRDVKKNCRVVATICRGLCRGI